jgi:hypothetical protein
MRNVRHFTVLSSVINFEFDEIGQVIGVYHGINQPPSF